MDFVVSIVVPVYNVEPYLEKCVNSIVNQTYQNIEIILVDDGSTDGSGIKCDEFAQKDKRIIVIHKENGGLSDARNVGIEKATGDYIMFIDSDDWIDADTVECAVQAVKDNNADVAIFGMYIDYSNAPSKTRIPLIKGSFDGKTALIYLNSFKNINEAACNKIYKTNLFNEIRYPKGKKCEDCFTTYKVFDISKTIVTIPFPKYHYFQRENSISKNSKVNMEYIEAAIEQCDYIKNKYPDISYIGETAVAFTYLIISGQKHKRSYSSDGMEEVFKSREYTNSVLKNRYLSLSRKVQFFLFAYATKLYRVIKG